MASIEMHAIEFEDKYILYRPLAGLAVVGNLALYECAKRKAEEGDASIEGEADAFLSEAGFLSPDPAPPPEAKAPDSRAGLRAAAVLLMTGECNLRCRYCYARGGEGAPAVLDYESARAAIDCACEGAAASGLDSFSLSFHGGGEPTLNREVLERAVAYARGLELPCRISMTSNGIWEDETRDFILKNIDELNLSFDGVEEVQNSQRPGLGGAPSFDRAMQSIAALDAAGIRYGIRMTTTDEWIEELPRSVAMLCERTACRVIQVEPSFSNRRGDYVDPSPEQGEPFVRMFLEAFDIATARGRSIVYSGSRPWLVSQEFCRAPREAVIVTPEGDLVACFEVYGREHPHFRHFAIGAVVEGHALVDEEREGAFLTSRDSRHDRCRGCFNYRHCGGDCDSRYLSSTGGTEGRCAVNKAITRGLLARYIERGEGLYRREARPASASEHCAGCGATSEDALPAPVADHLS